MLRDKAKGHERKVKEKEENCWYSQVNVRQVQKS